MTEAGLITLMGNRMGNQLNMPGECVSGTMPEIDNNAIYQTS